MEESTGSEVSSESSESHEPSSEETSTGESNTGSEAATEAVGDLQDKLQQAVDAGANDKQLKQMIKEFDLKVNGKSVKHTMDFSDEEAVKRELQKAYAFNDVSQEYATVRKQLNAKIAEWKNNPEQALQDLGIDPLEYAEKRINKEVEELKKDPQQKALEEAQRKLDAYAAKEKEAQERHEQSEREREDSEALSVLKQEITQALDKHPYIKPTELTERRVADMMAHYSHKFPNITAEQVIPHVENEMKAEFNALLEALPDDYLEKFFGKNAIDKLAKKFTKSAPVAKKPTPVTASMAKTATASGAKQGNEAQNKPKRTFEQIMASRK